MTTLDPAVIKAEMEKVNNLYGSEGDALARSLNEKGTNYIVKAV